MLIKIIHTPNLQNLVKAILPYLLPKKKEVENLNQFTEQPLFEVNVIDTKVSNRNNR